MRWLLLSTFVASITMSTAAASQTTLPLNTGFNNGVFGLYPLPSGPAVRDNYWIKVAASNPPTLDPTYVVNPNSAWATALSGGGFSSRWLSNTATGASVPGNPAWAVYRKCFCLMPGYTNPQLSFQLRGDDMVLVVLNSIGNTLVPLQGGRFGAGQPPIAASAQPSQFHAGVNCVLVLVLDTGSVVSGFDLAGTVSAYGLMPVAASGTGASFAPCQCNGSPGGAAAINERAAVQALVRIAEARRGGSSPQQ